MHDPRGIEGTPGSAPGLGLLEYETTIERDKQLRQVRGILATSGVPVSGYEMHMGVTTGAALSRPAIHLDDGRADGALSEDGQIFATYLHGLFEEPQACNALLAWAGLEDPLAADYAALREASIDRLADAMNEHIDMASLLAVMR